MMEEKITRAGPPKCVYCGEIKEAWTRKFVDDNSILWVCPNYCGFKDVILPPKESEYIVDNPKLQELVDTGTITQDTENPMLGMLPNLEANPHENICDNSIPYEKQRDTLPRKEIYVNTIKTSWNEEYITYEELVKLVNNKDKISLFTVVYSRGYGKDGTLTPNQSIKVKNGMVFDIAITSRV